ncbi:E3 ubiquitin-protein ligase RZF1-like isoform X2 [Dendrobium catenatum]|uniref:E3 ubiquitin-protein ligase RZF1-like isoform X2 n=1 Tax=Dendrobium catenatum TaxID=906689 RepID=UPI00109FE043|nr:E3 ubiquitin-protein ligase RZF1-like isoform X2 [Dendrobium catenatum]
MPPPSPPVPPNLRRRAVFRLFWCHQCRRPVSIIPSLSATSDLFCPRCFGPFVHDLDLDIPPPRPPPPPPPPRPPPANFLFDFSSPHPHLHLHHLFPTWTPFHPQLIHGQLALPPPPPPPPWISPSYSVRPALDPGDYFTGPNLSELIEELTENDRTGPPPATSSSIDALPTVAIAAAHLRGGSECPVCKEEFSVGEEAREMPCRHVYHSSCLVPWLRMHNSCPVCRFQLRGEEPATGERSREQPVGGGGNRRQRRRQVPERWNPFTVLPAFRGPSRPGLDSRNDGERREQGGDPMDSAAAFYSWWRSLFLL